MRLPTLLAAVALALVPAAQAQSSDDGCTQADPCPWVVDLDANGFLDYVETEMTVTVGDWYEITAFSDDNQSAHTLTLSGHDVSVHVPADGMAADTGAFQFAKAGTFTLTDAPSGDAITVHVVAGDAVAAQEQSAAAKGSPGLPLVGLGAALFALVALRRR